MDTVLDLAIVRNRLLAGKCDNRDRELLEKIQGQAALTIQSDVYQKILVWGISNAQKDMEMEDYSSAARELALVHNIPLSTVGWSMKNEEYFIRGALGTYLEHASISRIKDLFSLFKG